MKAYVKPALFYEHFELSQHIADCAIEFQNSGDANSCYALADSNFIPGLSGITLFNNGTGGCTQSVDYCYTGGAGGFNTFRS